MEAEFKSLPCGCKYRLDGYYFAIVPCRNGMHNDSYMATIDCGRYLGREEAEVEIARLRAELEAAKEAYNVARMTAQNACDFHDAADGPARDTHEAWTALREIAGKRIGGLGEWEDLDAAISGDGGDDAK